MMSITHELMKTTNNSMKPSKLNSLLLAAAAFHAGHANGALIAYEGFNPAGTDASVVGSGSAVGETSTGFSGNWVDSAGGGTTTRTSSNASITAYPSNVPFAAPAGGLVTTSAALTVIASLAT